MLIPECYFSNIAVRSQQEKHTGHETQPKCSQHHWKAGVKCLFLTCLCMLGHSMADSWHLLHRSMSWGRGAVLLLWDWIFLLGKVLQPFLHLRKSSLLSSAGLPAYSSLQNWASVVRVKLVESGPREPLLIAFQVVEMPYPFPCPMVFVRNDVQWELIETAWHLCTSEESLHISTSSLWLNHSPLLSIW